VKGLETTTSMKQPRNQLPSPVNPSPSPSAIYKTIMALRATHGPMDDEDNNSLITDPKRFTAYMRANSFTDTE
jgi:hypothetical protein